MKILGIDYGEKNIGLALSDELELIASPIDSLKVQSLSDAVRKILTIVKSQNIREVVIGIPLGPNGEETQQSMQVRHFARLLKDTNGVNLSFWNESFSTQQAESPNTISTNKKKKNLDSEAARIILQEFLDYKKENKNTFSF